MNGMYPDKHFEQSKRYAKLIGLSHLLCSIRIFNDPHTIRKFGIAGTVWKDHAFGPVRIRDFLPSVSVMVLNLVVGKVVCFHSVLMSDLRCLKSNGYVVVKFRLR